MTADWTINGRGDYERARENPMVPARVTTETHKGGYGFINSRINGHKPQQSPKPRGIRRVEGKAKWDIDWKGQPYLIHGKNEAWNELGPHNVNGTKQVTVKVGPKDTKITTCNRHNQSRPKGGVRDKIKRFTDDSRRRLIETMRNIAVPLVIMITLTYPGEFPTDGKKVKRDWAAMRKWLARRGIGGVLLLEFQARGAPHFHIFCPAPARLLNPRLLSQAWYRIVGSGDPKHLAAGTRIEWLRKPHAAAAYASKYASKKEQKEVPEGYQDVGRFWSCFGGVKAAWQYFTGKEWEMYGVIRLVRKAMEAVKRNSPFKRKPYKLNGRYGFTAYDVGDYIVRGVTACLAN